METTSTTLSSNSARYGDELKVIDKKSRVFISYASEDQALAQRLQNDFQRDEIDVFVDFTRITLGDSLPERINDGLEWCDTLVLLWSKHAAKSYYVSEEWETAFHLQRRIIPCVLDGTTLPPVLTRRLHLAITNYEEDYPKLCEALGVTTKSVKSSASTKQAREFILPLPNLAQ